MLWELGESMDKIKSNLMKKIINENMQQEYKST